LFRAGISPIITSFIASTGSGLANIISTRDFDRLNKVFKELLSIMTVLLTASGLFYIIFNQNIIKFWVGMSFYSSDHIEYLFLIVAVIQFSYGLLQYITDGLQMFSEKSIASLIGGAFFIISSLILLKAFNIKGLLFSAIISRVLASILLIYFLKVKAKIPLSTNIIFYQWLGLGIFFGMVAWLLQPLIPDLSLKQLFIYVFAMGIILIFPVFILLPKTFKKRLRSFYPLKK
jgi:O-antigen/teichoic acid export membrane protein